MFDVASPRVNGDGSFGGFIGSAIDTTDQKLAQQALEKVSGQLIEAQEKERSRIARDLHDDICQRLALLSMEIERANRTSNGSLAAQNKTGEHPQTLRGNRCRCSIAVAPAALLHTRLPWRCSRHKCLLQRALQTTPGKHRVHRQNVPRHLPSDISLCLFRIAQEALHNAVKYSETTNSPWP